MHNPLSFCHLHLSDSSTLIATLTCQIRSSHKLHQLIMICSTGSSGDLAMEVESCVPPGFRFHPTEEELVGYYLARKVAGLKIDLDVIRDVDLYRIEPWDLQDRCKYGHEEQSEWYFFSYKDRKYPSGTRTNRATAAGFWKATGRDKPVLTNNSRVIGMRKTLVFYKGRAPNGRKSDWIMHEYRLQTTEHGPTQEEGWVVCRAFKKPSPSQRPCFNNYTSSPVLHEYYSSCFVNSSLRGNFCEQTVIGYGGGMEDEPPKQNHQVNHAFDIIPDMESPRLSTSNLSTKECLLEGNSNVGVSDEHMNGSNYKRSYCDGGQLIDWKVLDKLLSSQLNEAAASSSNLASVEYDATGAQIQPAEHCVSLFHSS